MYGVEINKEASEKGNKRRLNILNGDLLDTKYPYNYFDVIRMAHVLEHVNNPSKTIAEVFRILKPGGAVIVYVPNFVCFWSKVFKQKWAGLDIPLHLYHFTKDSIRNLFYINNFFNITINFYSVGTGWSSLNNILLKKTTFINLTIKSILRFLFYFIDIVLNIVKKGDSIELYAYKNSINK